MHEFNSNQTNGNPPPRKASFAIPVGLSAAIIIAFLTFLGIGIRYYGYGDLDTIHCLLSLFLSMALHEFVWKSGGEPR